MKFPAVKIALVEKELRQVEIARRMGRDPAWLSRVIHGWVDPSPTERRELALLLAESEERLFGESVTASRSATRVVGGRHAG